MIFWGQSSLNSFLEDTLPRLCRATCLSYQIISRYITLQRFVWWNVPRRLWAHRCLLVGFMKCCLLVCVYAGCDSEKWALFVQVVLKPKGGRNKAYRFQWASANLHLHLCRSISEKKSKTYIFKFLRFDIYLISYFFLNLCENLELGCCLKRAQSKQLPKFKNWQNHFDHLYIHTHKYTKLYVFYNYQTLTFITDTHKHFDPFTHTILLTVSWSSDTQMT